MSEAEKKEESDSCVSNTKKYFYLKAAIMSLAIIVSIEWFSSTFRFGIDPQEVRCFPDHKYFLVNLRNTEAERNDVFAYYAKGLTPYFADGTLMAKVVTGVPGDHVLINEEGVFINGELVAEGFMLAAKLKKSESDFYTEFTIPERKYFMMAPAPESYDSRYWGMIDQQQLAGKATPLF